MYFDSCCGVKTDPICFSPHLYRAATWSNGSSTRSNSIGGMLPHKTITRKKMAGLAARPFAFKI
jgi:hypothetical protein